VPREMAGMGYALFRKQSGILILGLVAALWLFRRKEVGFYNRGEKLKKLERYEEAIAAYDQALKIQPKYYEAWYAKAYSLYRLQRYEHAIASYDQVIQLQPEEAVAWYIRGWMLGELQRYEEAIASYDKAIEIDPDSPEYWYFRGNALHNLQRNEDAIASYDKTLKIKADYSDAWYNKACCYSVQGNVSLAIESLQHAIDLDRDRFKEYAKTDTCFDTIRENQLFKNLVQDFTSS